MNILVCDDEQSILDSMKQILVSEGHKVTLTKSGDAAIKELQKKSFDMVFMDVLLAGEDGFDILGKIKKKKPNIIVVVLTAYVVREREAEELGVFDYIYKPFTVSRMRQVVKRVQEAKGERKSELRQKRRD
jgi:DNA-binding NtrC family response regulator